jgi:hypothetical protein
VIKEKDWFSNMDQKSSLNVAVSGKHIGATEYGVGVASVEMFHD